MIDWSHPIAVGLIAAAPPTLVALLAIWSIRNTRADVKQLHIEVDGRLTKLLESTKAQATAEGELKGAQDERDRGNNGTD